MTIVFIVVIVLLIIASNNMARFARGLEAKIEELEQRTSEIEEKLNIN